MKTLVIASVLLGICSALFFLAPHHRRVPESMKACTLSEIYRDFFQDMPSITSPRLILFLLLGLTGLITAFYPVAFVLLTRWHWPQPGHRGGFLFILGGIITILGAFANLFGMILSHMNFMFGGGNTPRGETPYLWVILFLQLGFGFVSFLFGISARFAVWLGPILRS